MNQEKEIMQTVCAASEYLAPKVKVVKLKRHQRICTGSNTVGVSGPGAVNDDSNQTSDDNMGW